jgi:hypothetical protein
MARQATASDAVTASGRLDLLVATHEHWDHISGFGQAADIFLDPTKLKIDRLWMAWTENPDDDLANQLRQRFDKRKKAVAMVGAIPEGDEAHPFGAVPHDARTGLEAFVGPLDEDVALGFGSKLTGRAILEKLKEVAGTVDFLRPGQVTSTPGEVPLRTYVLGPPRSTQRLFKNLPSSGEEKETYLVDPDVCEGPLVALAEGRPQDLSEHSPFGRPHRTLTLAEVDRRRREPNDPPDAVDKAAAWFGARYFAAHSPCRYGDSPPPGHKCETDLYCHADEARRRIDSDWMFAAGPLALKLDSDTNNTSLVLAFELPDGEILLFAADAQVGNWLSWHDQSYHSADGELSAMQLLERTILYKVGHHGSENATLEDKGLGAMKHPGLAAMIPVVEAVARKQPGQGWKMPFGELKADLLAKTSGRMLRGDCPPGTDLDGETQKTINTDPEFLGRVSEGPDQLWVEYRAAG